MSQHQHISFSRPVDGVRASKCGRFELRHLTHRANPNARWALTDLEVGAEVFCARTLKECRAAAMAIVASGGDLHPAAVANGIDASWTVGPASDDGKRHAVGDLVAWKAHHGVLPLEPVDVQRARQLEAEARALAEYRANVEAIEGELAATDLDAPDDTPVAVKIERAIRRPAVKSTTLVQHTGDDRGALHVVPTLRAPIPYPWVDLTARVYTREGVKRIEVRVYTRDDDTDADIWRRIKHATSHQEGRP